MGWTVSTSSGAVKQDDGGFSRLAGVSGLGKRGILGRTLGSPMLLAGMKKTDTCVVNSPKTSIDLFPKSPGAGYDHLLIMRALRGDTAAGTTTVNGFFNDDLGANYEREQQSVSSTTASSNSATGSTGAFFGDAVAASTAAGYFGMGFIFLPFYRASPGMRRMFMSWSGDFNGSVDEWRFSTGYWQDQVINKISLQPNTGNWDVGSRATLYTF